MSNNIIVRVDPVPASNIGGGTVHTAVHCLNLRAEGDTAALGDTLPLLTGVRNFFHGSANFRCNITEYMGYRHELPDFDAGNTVDSEYGFFCPGLNVGTNKYGFYADAFSNGGYPLYVGRGSNAYVFLGPNTGIGGTTALAAAHPLVVTSQGAASITAQFFGEANKEIVEIATFATAPVPTLRGWGSRGTKAAPVQTESGETLLRIAGTATNNAGTPAQTGVIAAIDLVAAQNITTTAQGTKIDFKMCPAGSTTLTTFVTMEAGLVTIAGQTTPELRLDSSGDTSEYLSITRTSASGVAKAMNHVAKPGQSYSIQGAGGAGDFVELGTSIQGDTDGISISMWIRPITMGTQLFFYVRGQDGAGNGWSVGIFKRTDDKVNFAIVTSAPAQVDCISTTVLSANTWYHVLAIWNKGNNLKLYINGTLETTTATAATQLRSSTVGTRLFRSNAGGAGADGFIDALQMWINTYVDSDASNLAAGGDPATTPNFQYKCNEGSGTTLNNTGSTAGNNGTLNGTVTYSTNIPSQNPLPVTPTLVQATVWQSQDGTVADCEGILTIGQAAGRTVNRGGQTWKRTTTATDYTATVTDYIIGVTSTAAARTITLPLAANAGAGMVLIVKDESGGAGTNNITIDGNGSETIDGAATKVINSNYGSVSLYCTGTAWFTF